MNKSTQNADKLRVAIEALGADDILDNNFGQTAPPAQPKPKTQLRWWLYLEPALKKPHWKLVPLVPARSWRN